MTDTEPGIALDHLAEMGVDRITTLNLRVV